MLFISTYVGQVIFYKTQLVVRRAGMWPSSRSAEKPASTPVTSLAANHVNFNVQNPTYGGFKSMVKGSQFEYNFPPSTSQNTRGATSG